MSEVLVKRVKAPLSVEEMKDAFLNKADRDAGKIKYIIDYNSSSIKGDILLQYLSNLEIQADFDFTGTSKNERFEFLLTYLKMKTIIKNNDLNLAAGSLLLVSKNINNFIEQNFLTEDEMQEFYVLHKNLVDKWSIILDSSLLMLIRVAAPQLSLDEYEDVVDPNYCGVNFVNLFNINGFFNAFTSQPAISNLKWFTHQFENFAFQNELLFKIICDSDESFSAPFNLLQATLDNTFSEDFLVTVDKELDDIGNSI
jgi:hypothetical protein